MILQTFTLQNATQDVREAIILAGIDNPTQTEILDMYCEAYKIAWHEGRPLEPYTEQQALEAFAKEIPCNA